MLNLDREGQSVNILDLGRETLDPDYGARVLFLSYKYSQGANPLQHSIMRYLHKLRPNWRIEDEGLKASLYQRASRSVLGFVLPQQSGSPLSRNPGQPDLAYHNPKGEGYLQTADSITDDLKDELNAMQIIFNDLQPPRKQWSVSEDTYDPNDMSNLWDDWQNKLHELPLERLVPILTKTIVGRDFYFLATKGGRFRKPDISGNPALDRWISHTIEYALRGRRSGLPEFDQMFRDVRNYITRNEIDNVGTYDDKRKLPEVISIYNEHHPDTPFMPGDLEVLR